MKRCRSSQKLILDREPPAREKFPNHRIVASRCFTDVSATMPNATAFGARQKVLLVGNDQKNLLERRLRTAGWEVVRANDHESALHHARHEPFNLIVLVSAGSLINVTEAIFNLRDVNESIEIIVLIDRRLKPGNRFLRQLLQYPIEGTRIVTRRQLQQQLHAAASSVSRNRAI